MLRFFVKSIGLLALVLAVITAVLDLTRSIANSAFTTTALGENWASFHRESLLLLEPAVSRYLHPFVWNPIMQGILSLPGWFVFLVLGLIFLWLGRRRQGTWHERFGR